MKILYKGMVLMTLLFLWGAVPAFSQAAREAILSKIQPPVEIKIQGEDWKDAQRMMVLHEKDEIRTAARGSVEIILDRDGSSGKLQLREKSHLKLTRLTWEPASGEKSTFLDLAIGKVLVHAEKLTPTSKFEIRTPTATTGVRGTIFEVLVVPVEER